MKKKLFLFLLIVLITISIKNLGYFFDTTSQPIKADMIVSLGGIGNDRIKKALFLYKKDFSNSKTILLTGVTPYTPTTKFTDIDERVNYLNKHDIPLHNVVLSTDTHNTFQEARFIKQYMLSHHMRSVLVVSDAPHARRILFFTNTVFNYPQSRLNIRVISSDAPWWNTQTYYTNKTAITFVSSECIKYVYYTMHYYFGSLKG